MDSGTGTIQNDQRHTATNKSGAFREVAPLAVSVADFCRLTSLKKTSAYQLIRENKVEVRRLGGRTLVLMRSIEALLGLTKEHGS